MLGFGRDNKIFRDGHLIHEIISCCKASYLGGIYFHQKYMPAGNI